MPPGPLPLIMSKYPFTPVCFKFAIFLLWSSGQKKMRKHGSLLATYIIHTESIIMLWTQVAETLAQTGLTSRKCVGTCHKSPPRIGLMFNADLSELLSTLSSPWELNLSSGCLPFWHESNSSCFSPLICSLYNR